MQAVASYLPVCLPAWIRLGSIETTKSEVGAKTSQEGEFNIGHRTLRAHYFLFAETVLAVPYNDTILYYIIVCYIIWIFPYLKNKNKYIFSKSKKAENLYFTENIDRVPLQFQPTSLTNKVST